MKDQLGDKIKDRYEDCFRLSLPKRTYGIIRIDGKAFHTFTRGLERPFCKELFTAMNIAALSLAKEMMGCKLAYGQSDEFSFLFSDLSKDDKGGYKDDTEMWFSGNIQKIVSISASVFTAAFNEAWRPIAPRTGYGPAIINQALFDARVFVIPNRLDVPSYFTWRQADATRNSLNMLASCHFSHKQLQGMDSAAKHEMLHSVGVNWNSQSIPFKRGRVILRQANQRKVSYVHKKTKKEISLDVEEMAWAVDEKIPVFAREKSYLDGLIP